MPEIDLWKVFVSLGVPGVVLGIFYILFRQFNWKLPLVEKKWGGPLLFSFMVLVAFITLYALTLWAPVSDLTTVRISVLGIEKMPIEDSRVWSSIGGEAQKITGGWELEFASSKLPENRKVVIYAAQKQGQLKGHREILVQKGKTTSISIQLERDNTAEMPKESSFDHSDNNVQTGYQSIILLGEVIDSDSHKPITDKQVFITIDNYDFETLSDSVGKFNGIIKSALSDIIVLRASHPDYKSVKISKIVNSHKLLFNIVMEKRAN